MIILGILLSTILIIYGFARIIWMFKNIKSYIFVMASYAKLNNITLEEIRKKCKISPLLTIFLEFNHWDFTRYIYFKQDYCDACTFHIKLMFDVLNAIAEPETEKDNSANK